MIVVQLPIPIECRPTCNVKCAVLRLQILEIPHGIPQILDRTINQISCYNDHIRIISVHLVDQPVHKDLARGRAHVNIRQVHYVHFIKLRMQSTDRNMDCAVLGRQNCVHIRPYRQYYSTYWNKVQLKLLVSYTDFHCEGYEDECSDVSAESPYE